MRELYPKLAIVYVGEDPSTHAWAVIRTCGSDKSHPRADVYQHEERAREKASVQCASRDFGCTGNHEVRSLYSMLAEIAGEQE